MGSRSFFLRPGLTLPAPPGRPASDEPLASLQVLVWRRPALQHASGESGAAGLGICESGMWETPGPLSPPFLKEAPGRLGTGQVLGNVSAGKGFKGIAGMDGLEGWKNSGWDGPMWSAQE